MATNRNLMAERAVVCWLHEPITIRFELNVSGVSINIIETPSPAFTAAPIRLADKLPYSGWSTIEYAIATIDLIP